MYIVHFLFTLRPMECIIIFIFLALSLFFLFVPIHFAFCFASSHVTHEFCSIFPTAPSHVSLSLPLSLPRIMIMIIILLIYINIICSSLHVIFITVFMLSKEFNLMNCYSFSNIISNMWYNNRRSNVNLSAPFSNRKYRGKYLSHLLLFRLHSQHWYIPCGKNADIRENVNRANGTD